MDCRKTSWLSLLTRRSSLATLLLLGAAGCTRQVASGPAVPPAQAANSSAPMHVDTLPLNAVVKKETDLPMRAPHPKTLVALGDSFTLEAAAPEVTDRYRQQKREYARQCFQQALTIDPHYLPGYLSLAQLYVTLKDHDHAMATYRKACQMFPNEARVFFEMGRCYGAQQEWDQAIQALAHAVELNMENRQYVDTLAWMQARAGRYDESLKTFRKIHDEGEAYYKLALMLEHLNQPDRCKQLLQMALAKDPRLEGAQALLTELNNPAAGVVQPASYSESAKPATEAAIPPAAIQPTITVQPEAALPLPLPLPAMPAPTAAPTGSSLVLPPPPRISIHYETPPVPTPEAGDAAATVK